MDINFQFETISEQNDIIINFTKMENGCGFGITFVNKEFTKLFVEEIQDKLDKSGLFKFTCVIDRWIDCHVTDPSMLLPVMERMALTFENQGYKVARLVTKQGTLDSQSVQSFVLI